MTIVITVNGTERSVSADRGEEKLLDYLHDDLNLTGTKLCCGIGICRACTVSVKKQPGAPAEPMISCSTPLSLLHKATVVTVEGVADGDNLHPLQEAFLKNFSFQCGYCAPGFVMGAFSFLDGLKAAPVAADKLDAAIIDALDSHICRCTGYVRYVEAVKAVALELMGSDKGAE